MPYSSKWKIFWYTPARTASRSCSMIMDHFDFEQPRDHSFIETEEHKSYYLVCNVRNPYSRLFSLYMLKLGRETKSSFDQWLKTIFFKNKLNGPKYTEVFCNNFFWNSEKKPDYLVRVESLYEDLSNLFLIKENPSEELNQLMKSTIRENPYARLRKIQSPWYEHYNEVLADLVKTNFEKDFELFGYDINSWKNGTP